MKTQIVTGAKGREYCGACGKVLDLNEKTECKCSQCGAELLCGDEFFLYLTEKECFLIRTDTRPKGYKYKCSECTELCYMPNGTFYKYCPHCGKKVQDVLHRILSITEILDK